jgi:hypothetical protein
MDRGVSRSRVDLDVVAIYKPLPLSRIELRLSSVQPMVIYNEVTRKTTFSASRINRVWTGKIVRDKYIENEEN